MSTPRALAATAIVLCSFISTTARAVCTMPAGNIELYAAPGSHNAPLICGPGGPGNQTNCSLSGWLYKPANTATPRPLLVFIQGSPATQNQSKFCSMIDYFVSQKYVVWVPYMRGYIDTTSATVTDPNNTVYVNNGNTGDPSLGFTNSGVYFASGGSAQTLSNMGSEVDNEITWSIDYLLGKYPTFVDTSAIVLMGHSLGGGTVTMAANRTLASRLAAIVDLSGGVLSWYTTDANGSITNNPDPNWSTQLCNAVTARTTPMLFSQVMNESPIWGLFSLNEDIASTQSVYNCAISGTYTDAAEMTIHCPISTNDLTIAPPWCTTNEKAYHCAHTTFFMKPDEVSRWDTQVKDFLARHGVNP